MLQHILFLTPYLPFPPEQGTALRNYNLLRLAARICKVSLLSFASETTPVPEELASLCQDVRLVSEPASRRISERLRTLVFSQDADMAQRLHSEAFASALGEMADGGTYDALQVEGIELAPYALGDAIRGRIPIIYDAHNAEWLLQQRAARADWQHVTRWPAAAYSSVQWRRLRKLERQICLASSVVLACSEMDASALQALEPQISIHVLPNGVDSQHCIPGSHPANLRHPALVFTGKMDYRPNVDAVRWFVQEVLPQIRAEVPQTQFYIVGKNPAPAVQALAEEAGVHVTGYVPSVQPYLTAADCYIAPLRVGGGTRLKLLEAMSYGLPIVSTTLGAEGLDVTSSKHLLLAHSADAFAQAVLRLLKDQDFATQLGKQARELVCSRYDWELLAPGLQEAYEQVEREQAGASR